MIDLAIVLAFVAYSVAAGFRARREASRGLADYFLAGRTLRGWRAGVSMAATQYAADTPLLVSGLVAAGGVYSLWRLWIYGLAFLLLAFVLGHTWRRAGVLTDAELTEIRYSGRGVVVLRTLKALYYGTLINCVVMAFVLAASVRLFEVFVPWHEWLPSALYEPLLAAVAAVGLELSSGVTGLPADVATLNAALSVALTLGFVTLYSTTGGLRSVVTTDVAQFALMMLGTALYAVAATRAAGGLDGMLAALTEHYGPARAAEMTSFVPHADAAAPFLVVISLQWLFQMNSDGSGYLAQRMMACSTDRQARIAAVVFTLVQLVARSLLWLPIAIALLVLYPIDGGAPMSDEVVLRREMLFAHGIDQLLGTGARGLMLTGMLAALASTLDTHLNWGASYWCNDLYKALWVERWRKRTASAHELVVVARLSNVLVMALALVIMVNLGSLQAAWHASLLFGAGIGMVLVARWLWERINLHAEIAAIVVSSAAAPVLMHTVGDEWTRLAAMAGLSTVAVVLAARLGPLTDERILTEFYRRVEPPGWWTRTARAAGADPRRSRRALARGCACVVAASATVYGLLVGAGMLVVQPDRALTAAALLAIAAAAAPYWARRL